MPPIPRIFYPDAVCHLINRGNNSRQVFLDDEDFLTFVNLIRETKQKYGYLLNKVILIPNHYHIKAVSPDDDSLSAAMHKIDGTYAKYFNKKYELVGHLWQGRFKSYLITDDAYDTACSVYIDLNSVRAGLVKDPAEYMWSSCAVYLKGTGVFEGLIDLDNVFTSLAENDELRRVAYRALLESSLERGMTKDEAKSLFRKMSKNEVKR